LLADELDLHLTPIAQHNREIDFGRSAAISSAIKFDVINSEKRPSAYGLGPEMQRGLEVIRHIGHLHYVSQPCDRRR